MLKDLLITVWMLAVESKYFKEIFMKYYTTLYLPCDWSRVVYHESVKLSFLVSIVMTILENLKQLLKQSPKVRASPAFLILPNMFINM